MTNVRVFRDAPITEATSSSFTRASEVHITVGIDTLHPDWIGIHVQSVDYCVINSLYMPMEAAESVAFQIQALVQERLRGNP